MTVTTERRTSSPEYRERVNFAAVVFAGSGDLDKAADFALLLSRSEPLLPELNAEFFSDVATLLRRRADTMKGGR